MLLLTEYFTQTPWFLGWLIISQPIGVLLYFTGFNWLASAERKRFSRRLRALREGRGLSAQQVYNRTGIDVQYLESNPHNLLLPAGTLLDITHTLGGLYKEPIKPGFLLLG